MPDGSGAAWWTYGNRERPLVSNPERPAKEAKAGTFGGARAQGVREARVLNTIHKPGETLVVSAEAARRLTVTKQHLMGRLPRRASGDEMVSLIRELPFIQWDPVSILAPSHIISLWSRLGGFRPADLDRLLWNERKLFLHWTPIAFVVLAEDYPMYRSLMERYPESLSRSWGAQRESARKFLSSHQGLRRRMLAELRDGPLRTSEFADYRGSRSADGWGSGSDVATMLYHLHMRGEAMVARRQGNQNVWDLTERVMPSWADREAMTEVEFEREAALKAIRALGTATPSEIAYYFVPGRYLNLGKTLARLQGESVIQLVKVEGTREREDRYIHHRDIALLESLSGGAWRPRVTLLAPFDNLIRGRQRTNTVFGFDYVHEQFLPKAKRKFGTYLLPILDGDRLIGRIDASMDRRAEKMVVSSVHAERGAPTGRDVAAGVGEAVSSLAGLLGAREVAYSARVPPSWKSSLR